MTATHYKNFRLSLTFGKNVNNQSIACVRQAVNSLMSDASFTIASQKSRKLVIDIAQGKNPIPQEQVDALQQRFQKWRAQISKEESVALSS